MRACVPHRLNPKVGGPYMSEALDEMVQLLTEPAYCGKMVVILAGYEQQVGQAGREAGVFVCTAHVDVPAR